jgi:hypothetical protein
MGNLKPVRLILAAAALFIGGPIAGCTDDAAPPDTGADPTTTATSSTGGTGAPGGNGSGGSETPSGPLPLDELPADYTSSQAAADGVYVNAVTSGTSNQQAFDDFVAAVTVGTPATLRALYYTTEGDSVLMDYEFDGTVYTLTTDSTRDQYGAQNITTETYEYLVPFMPPSYNQTMLVFSHQPAITEDDWNADAGAFRVLW